MSHPTWLPTVADLGDRLATLTLAEAAQLSCYLEQVHGVMARRASTIEAHDVQPDVLVDHGHVVPLAFDVVLEAVDPARRIAAIKALREATGLGLKEAKELADATPHVVKAGLPRAEAEAIRATLEVAGGTVSLRPTAV